MNFIDIYDSYYERVKKFIHTLVKDEWASDDLIQETFVRVKQNLDKIREPSKTSSWVFRIAYNLCQDHFKNQKKGDLNVSDKIWPSNDIPLLKKFEQKQMADCVKEKMNYLPEPLRIVLTLFDILEFSHKEIAEILSISEENAKVRLHRARKELKSILNQKCTFEYDERNVLVCEPVNIKD